MTKIYNRMLVEFMQAKAKKLHKYSNKILITDYFNSTDKKNLMLLHYRQAHKTWEELKVLIKYYDTAGLGTGTCPFCILRTLQNKINCNTCIYGKEHGRCHAENFIDSYSKISNILDTNEKDIGDILTKTFYKRLIKDLENKYIKEK